MKGREKHKPSDQDFEPVGIVPSAKLESAACENHPNPRYENYGPQPVKVKVAGPGAINAENSDDGFGEIVNEKKNENYV
jgi:hypothetical protein